MRFFPFWLPKFPWG